MAEGKFVDQVSKIMIRFTLKPFPIAVNSSFKVANSFLSLCLLKALIAYG